MRACAGNKTLSQAVVPRCLLLLFILFALRASLLPLSACLAVTAAPVDVGAGGPPRGARGWWMVDLCERGLHLVVGSATFLKVRVTRASVARH